MTSVVIVVPVLGRPERVRPLVESAEAATRGHDVCVFFVVSPSDELERGEIRNVMRSSPIVNALDVEWEPGRADYARKINAGFAVTEEEFVFLGADDLRFHDGWLDKALDVHAATGACVIGTNDDGNPAVKSGRHATHSLVHRDYGACGTIDEPDSGKLLCDLYDHNWVDNEFVATAHHRGAFAMALDSHVEHEHPHWGKGTDDATYRKGQARFAEDRALFQRRSRLWR